MSGRRWTAPAFWRARRPPTERGVAARAIGRSLGGLTAKIAAFVDTPENGALTGDKAFDADWLVDELEERGRVAANPPKSNGKVKRNSAWRCTNCDTGSRTSSRKSSGCEQSRRAMTKRPPAFGPTLASWRKRSRRDDVKRIEGISRPVVAK